MSTDVPITYDRRNGELIKLLLAIAVTVGIVMLLRGVKISPTMGLSGLVSGHFY